MKGDFGFRISDRGFHRVTPHSAIRSSQSLAARVIGLLGVAMMLSGVPVWSDSGLTGAAFLKNGVGARGRALGEAYTARVAGAEALFWNPAGLRVMSSQFFITHHPMAADTAQRFAAVAFPAGPVSFGAGYGGLAYDAVPGFDDVGNRLADFDASDTVAVVGASFGDRVRLGVAGKFIRSTIAGRSADTWAGDAGLSFGNPWWDRLTHALVVRNVGGGLSFIDQTDPLPLTAIVGTAIRVGGRLRVTVDGGYIRETGGVAAGGVEWRPFGDGGLALRGGYTTRTNEAEGLSGAGFGVGLPLGPLRLDYAWVPGGELDDGQLFSITWIVRRPSNGAAVDAKGAASHRSAGVQAVINLKDGTTLSGIVLDETSHHVLLKTDHGRVKVLKRDLAGHPDAPAHKRHALGDIPR